MSIVRKAGIFAGIIALITGSVLVLHSDQARADEERIIPVIAWKESFNPEETDYFFLRDVKEGDACAVSPDHPSVLAGQQQITVRDENNTIIAVERLNGTYQPGSDEGTLHCFIELQIEVPERAFYSVYLGENLIVTFAEDELPLSEQDSIFLTFDSV